MTLAADREFSAFLRVMEVISSVEAEVSSSDAACSVEPCASDWLEQDTCVDALAICWEPDESSLVMVRSVRLTRYTIVIVTAPVARLSRMNKAAVHLALDVVERPCAAISARRAR